MFQSPKVTLRHYWDLKELTFDIQIKSIMAKENKTIGLIRKFQRVFPTSFLVTIYKTFIRSHSDYGNIRLDQAFNDSFHHKMESVKFVVTLVITETIRNTSKEKNYQEMGFESLKYRRRFRKLPVF